MFLESYKASWILTEDHSFEDRMIDDLSVSWGLPGDVGQGWVGLGEPSI